MITYQFDSTFEGLITCFYYALKNKETPRFIDRKTAQICFLDTILHIDSDFGIYKKMESYIIDKSTFPCFDAIYKAFLSDFDVNYSYLFHFLKVSFTYREQTLFLRNQPIIYDVLKAKLAVEREAHKMNGFLRFKRLSPDFLYAKYAPTHNVTSLICHHFADRFNQYNFIIHDEIRSVYAIFDQKNVIMATDTGEITINDCDMEDEFNDFYKVYHEHVAIKERRNLKLQMNLMPKKYWHFISEMQKNTK